MTPSHPDPRRGVFETLLVVSGEPIELDAHLGRLAQSLKAVYEAELPTDVREKLISAADGISLGRLRLIVVPGKDGPRHDLLAGEVVPGAVFPEQAARLRQHPLSGGLGAHKWVDRTGLNPFPDGTGAVIADGTELLEAGWANLFAITGGVVRTPPADGRILPGVARAAILKLAPDHGYEVREEPLDGDDLLTAEEVFLTNSIRGVEACLSLDGAPLAGAGPVSNRLAGALAQSWRLPAPRHAPPTPAAAPIPGPPAR